MTGHSIPHDKCIRKGNGTWELDPVATDSSSEVNADIEIKVIVQNK